MSNLDPYRPAENTTECPRCGTELAWNNEDGLNGQQCACGHIFTGPTSEPRYEVHLTQAQLSMITGSLLRDADNHRRHASSRKMAGDALKKSRKMLRDVAKTMQELATLLDEVG